MTTRERRWRRAARAAAMGLLLAAPAARAQFSAAPVELVTAGKTVLVRHRLGKPPTLVLRATLAGRSATLLDPTCPGASAVEIGLAAPPADFASSGELALPCEGWTATRRGGYRFRGGGEGVTEVRYGPKRLVVRVEGTVVDFVRGPVAYLEVWLTVRGERRLVRVHDFKRNAAERIVSRRPTPPAARGEAAFWDTVWGDDPRPDDAVAQLAKAVRRRRDDGRSHFLLGMIQLWALQDVDPFMPGADGSQRVRTAQTHLDAAVGLLPHDFRIPGFRAALTYANGVAHDDETLRTLGLARLEAAVAADPVFNSFDFFAIAPVFPVLGSSEFFQTWFVDLADLLLNDNATCVVERPGVCSNVGMAPHNIEGTFILLGDVYAKGGRPDDAELWWGLAQTIGTANGYRYLDLLDDRIGHAAARSALYGDTDLGNDPPFMDGGIGYCRYCHQK